METSETVPNERPGVKAVILGQGYVGLPLALAATSAGVSVVGFDVSSELAEALNKGISHIDDVTDEELQNAVARGYRASSDPDVIADAHVVVVCVPTPLHPDGGPDLSAVLAAADLIGPRVRSGSTVILESTTYPGTTEEVFGPRVRDLAGPDCVVHLAFSPERVDPGNANFGIENTPKVVGGQTPQARQRAADFYSRFVDTVVEAKGLKEAEMAKLIENTFRHVNIALMNEMVRFCDDLDVDLWDAIDCAATKPFGYMPFRPGPGVGGHCIPVDPSYLSHRVKAKLGYAFRMVELAQEINSAAPSYVAARVWRALNDKGLPVRGARVLLLGVTYKPDIADRRESPADPLASMLLDWGAELSYWDPFVPTWEPEGAGQALRALDDLPGALAECDIAVLLQQHRDMDLAIFASAETTVLDTRGALPAGPGVIRL